MNLCVYVSVYIYIYISIYLYMYVSRLDLCVSLPWGYLSDTVLHTGTEEERGVYSDNTVREQSVFFLLLFLHLSLLSEDYVHCFVSFIFLGDAMVCNLN